MIRSGTWSLDALHSQIMVSVRHFNVANLRAKFPVVKGSLEVDTEDPLRSSFQVEIDATSVTTGHPAQEDYMRSEPWLDAEHHPRIAFVSNAIEPHGDEYMIRGELSFRGVSREIVIPFRFHGVVSDPWGLRAGFTSQFTLDRHNLAGGMPMYNKKTALWALFACGGLGGRRSRRCFHHGQRLPDEGRNIAGLA
jgi:polyisoprenoid-binding protein YceI